MCVFLRMFIYNLDTESFISKKICQNCWSYHIVLGFSLGLQAEISSLQHIHAYVIYFWQYTWICIYV